MRLAIVNDMPLAIEAMKRVIRNSENHSLAWVAQDGAQAAERCRTDTPDLILMDLMMPVMDGVEATRRIMAENPCAILIVTASVFGNSGKVFEAMGAGALDAVRTPVLGSRHGDGAAELLYKIDSIGRMIGLMKPQFATGLPESPDAQFHPPLVAIGASAGGPGAIADLLAALPVDFPAGIAIIQHVDPQFAPGMADWLNTRSKLPVRIARNGDRIRPGQVLLAAGEEHLVFRDSNTLGYTPEPATAIYRPSVNVFFDSIARYWKKHAIGILLTGMGRDGASGLDNLRKAGHHTIAQDRGTSAVYGMPKAAAELGAAKEILPLQQMATALTKLLANPHPHKRT